MRGVRPGSRLKRILTGEKEKDGEVMELPVQRPGGRGWRRTDHCGWGIGSEWGG